MSAGRGGPSMTATAAGMHRSAGASDSESLVDKAGVCDRVIFCFALAFSSLVILGLAPGLVEAGLADGAAS